MAANLGFKGPLQRQVMRAEGFKVTMPRCGRQICNLCVHIDGKGTRAFANTQSAIISFPLNQLYKEFGMSAFWDVAVSCKSSRHNIWFVWH